MNKRCGAFSIFAKRVVHPRQMHVIVFYYEFCLRIPRPSQVGALAFIYLYKAKTDFIQVKDDGASLLEATPLKGFPLKFSFRRLDFLPAASVSTATLHLHYLKGESLCENLNI